MDAGHLKGYKTVGGHRRIRKEDLDNFVQEHDMPMFEQDVEQGPKKILVVDDDRIVLETIVQALEEDDHGYELISAMDGFEAGVQLGHFNPDLVILDIMMPDINGYDVCKTIKCNPETKDTKIIVLSGYLDEENFRRMKGYGADRCFSKPLPLDQLKREVASILGLIPGGTVD
jgi:CheY-like chemotaxis protein